MLPFTGPVYFSLLASYNADLWPAQIFAYGLAIVALAMACRPFPGSGRAVSALLAASWIAIGLAFHLDRFAGITFAAPAYGALFILQGLLFLWTGTARGAFRIGLRSDTTGLAGLALAIYALTLYPLAAWLQGHGWPMTPLVGLSGAPTTIFTIGLLLLGRGRIPYHLLAIPVLWSLIAGAHAAVLGIAEDIALPLAGLGGLAFAFRRNLAARRAERRARQTG